MAAARGARVPDGRTVFYQSLCDQLAEFAERQFELAAPDEGGISYRKVLEGLLRRARRPDKRAEYEAALALPPFPMPLLHIWRAYHRIRRRKGAAGFGAAPIEWPDISEFVRMTRTRLLPREVEMLERLDDAFIAAATGQSGSEAGGDVDGEGLTA